MARGMSPMLRWSDPARGRDSPDSDTEITIGIEPEAPVDVVERKSLKPTVKPAATSDAIHAFCC